MDAAERLFSEWGFAATSLRHITAEAEVNLAAVNYYFGSKENLYVAVISRGVEPINRQRLAFLDAARARHPQGALAVEEILGAFCRPCVEFIRDESRQPLLKLLGKSMHENEAFTRNLMEREWKPVCDRFLAELQAALVHLPPAELAWRFHFTVGAMIHAISQSRSLEILTSGLCRVGDGTDVLEQLIAFCAAGLRQPAGVRP